MGKVSEFSRKYVIDRNTLTAYIRRHPEIFEGHTQRKGRDIVIDEVAETELEKAYHPQIVVNTPDPALIEAQKKIDELLERIVILQTELMNREHDNAELSRKLIEAEMQKKLLEDTQGKLQNAENDRLQAQTELNDMKVQAAVNSAENDRLRAEIERLKHRNWIQRLFNV